MAVLPTPKVLYQTWKTKDVPVKFKENREKWFDVTVNATGGPSEWKYVLLDDADLRELVKTHFPKHLSAYDSFTKNIERVDFARLVMMWLGGVYADLDTYPTQPIDRWVAENKIVLGREPVEHARDLYDGRETVLCNAFIISPPGLTTWVDLMEFIVKRYEPNFKPVYNTGPMAMTLFHESRPDAFAGAIITDPCVFFPLTGDGKRSARCTNPSQTYVVHQWENTWVTPWWRDQEWLNRRYWFWGLVALFAVVWLRVHNGSRRTK